MSLDPRAARFLHMLAAGSEKKPIDKTSLAERRAALESLLHLGSQPIEEVAAEDASIAGPAGPLPIRTYSPAGASPTGPVLIYFHGGGLIAGSIASHDGIARSFCRASRCRVMSVGYRLAPEHPFPAALEDALASIRQIASGPPFDGTARALGVCGDSAGAALAAAAVQQLALDDPRLIKLQILLCPILDYTLATASKREFARGYLLQEDAWQQDLKLALSNGLKAEDARVSPLRALPTSLLPRTLIHTAEFDPMRDEGQLYAQALEQQGVEVSYTCHPGMIHLFYGLGAILPQANTAFALIGGQIRTAFGLT